MTTDTLRLSPRQRTIMLARAKVDHAARLLSDARADVQGLREARDWLPVLDGMVGSADVVTGGDGGGDDGGPVTTTNRGIDMAQGQFTKEEAQATAEAVKEVFEALPKSKMRSLIGHANDIYLFLAAAEKAAPAEADVAKGK